jgi:anhydro-N-acetylmuramic acid kinase
MRVAGIMSGTSLDGVDVAVVDIEFDEETRTVRTAGTFSQPYDDALRAALLAVSDCQTHTRDIARLHFLLPRIYAEAVAACCKRENLDPRSIELIGSHGQTIYHEGAPADFHGRQIASTLQIGDGSVLAELAGAPVVSDFRPRDIAAGGQGAPLVPYVDYLLFAHESIGRVMLNIGGIANITILPAGGGPDDVLAFDTGPGNMVMDQLAAHYSGGARRHDVDGALAAEGSVDPDLLAALLADEFYRRPPPKSAGREQYGAAFVRRLLDAGLSPEDTMATACSLTAASIAEGVYAFGNGEDDIEEVLVSGGGVHNPALMRYLRAELADMEVVSTAAHGMDPDFKEAIAFAILAHESFRGRPSNLPRATGARHPVVLGKISR